jgi:hypothetical protein
MVCSARQFRAEELCERLEAALRDWCECVSSGREDATREASRRVAACVEELREFAVLDGASRESADAIVRVRAALDRCRDLIARSAGASVGEGSGDGRSRGNA